MIKLPKDKYGNKGWVVRARKAHRCDSRGYECSRIQPGDFYYRATAWPGSDANNGSVPWVLHICRACLLSEEMGAAFDTAVSSLATKKGATE